MLTPTRQLNLNPYRFYELQIYPLFSQRHPGGNAIQTHFTAPFIALAPAEFGRFKAELRGEAMTEERTYTVILTEDELTLVVSALSHLEKRHLYLEALARGNARDREAQARRESATRIVALSDKLYTIGAKKDSL